MAFIIFFFFLKKFEKVEKTGIISTKFSLRCTPSVILGFKDNILDQTTDRAFFSKIRNFWAWADKLGRNFMRHFGYFWPNYKHYFGTVSPLSMGKCSWFSFLQKTLIFRSKTYNSQILPK